MSAWETWAGAVVGPFPPQPVCHSASCPRGTSSSTCFSRRPCATLASGEPEVAPCRVALGSQELPLIGKTRDSESPRLAPPLWRVDPTSRPVAASLCGRAPVPPRPPGAGRGAPGGSGGSLTEDRGGVPRSKPSGPSAFQGQDVPPSSCRTTCLVLLTASPAWLCTPGGSPSTLFPYGAADRTQLRGLLPALPWRWALTAPPVPWEPPCHEASWGEWLDMPGSRGRTLPPFPGAGSENPPGREGDSHSAEFLVSAATLGSPRLAGGSIPATAGWLASGRGTVPEKLLRELASLRPPGTPVPWDWV